MKPTTLVFDLDGTISDPLVGIHRCINYALVAHGFEAVARSEVAGLVGPPLDDAFRALVGDQDDRLTASLVSKYRERYGETGYAENTLYEGVADALGNLHDRGVSLGVCTSKRADFAEMILKMFDLRELFRFVDGGDVGITKAQQLKALSGAGRVDAGTTMIGDRAVDIVAARTNGLCSAGVLWGYGSKSELTAAGARIIVARVSELPRLAGRT